MGGFMPKKYLKELVRENHLIVGIGINVVIAPTKWQAFFSNNQAKDAWLWQRYIGSGKHTGEYIISCYKNKEQWYLCAASGKRITILDREGVNSWAAEASLGIGE